MQRVLFLGKLTNVLNINYLLCFVIKTSYSPFHRLATGTPPTVHRDMYSFAVFALIGSFVK